MNTTTALMPIRRTMPTSSPFRETTCRTAQRFSQRAVLRQGRLVSLTDGALACAVAIQRRLADHRKANGFAPPVRIGVHASQATQVAQNFRGKGVHEASRIADLAEGGEILASRETAAGSRYQASEPRTVTGMGESIEIVSLTWH